MARMPQLKLDLEVAAAALCVLAAVIDDWPDDEPPLSSSDISAIARKWAEDLRGDE